jgi:hypothetical protein
MNLFLREEELRNFTPRGNQKHFTEGNEVDTIVSIITSCQE